MLFFVSISDCGETVLWCNTVYILAVSISIRLVFYISQFILILNSVRRKVQKASVAGEGKVQSLTVCMIDFPTKCSEKILIRLCSQVALYLVVLYTPKLRPPLGLFSLLDRFWTVAMVVSVDSVTGCIKCRKIRIDRQAC